jgi:hypothetical protein
LGTAPPPHAFLQQEITMAERVETLAPQEAGVGPAQVSPESDLRARQEALLDEGVEETFPASDPVAVMRLI